MPLLGKGSTLGVDDGAGGYDLIGGVENANFDAGTADEVDVTDWGSPDGYEEVIQGIKRGGNVTFQTNEDPAGTGSPASNYDKVVTFHGSGEVKEWQLKIGPTPTATITFDAIVTNYSLASPTQDKVLTSVTLKLSGAPTWS